MKGIIVIAIAILLLPSIFGMNIQDEMQENHDYKVVMAIEKHGNIVKAYARMINATTNKFTNGVWKNSFCAHFNGPNHIKLPYDIFWKTPP